MSKNSIEFSLSNSEQRDSWLNSGHRTLDTDKREEVQVFVENQLRNRYIQSSKLP